MLHVDSLVVRYGGIQAVREVSLEVQEGELIALLGPNGAGKSSTLNAIAGMVRPASGTVMFDGRDITGLPPEEVVRRAVVLTPEGRRILTALTVRENLQLAGSFRSDRRAAKADLDALLDRFPILRDRAELPAGTLSGGEAQQLAIARSLMCAPRLLLLDEPTLGLAPKIVDQVFDVVSELRREGITVLMVEQNAVRALEIADRAYVMRTGTIVTSGSAESLSDADGLIHSYLGGEQ